MRVVATYEGNPIDVKGAFRPEPVEKFRTREATAEEFNRAMSDRSGPNAEPQAYGSVPNITVHILEWDDVTDGQAYDILGILREDFPQVTVLQPEAKPEPPVTTTVAPKAIPAPKKSATTTPAPTIPAPTTTTPPPATTTPAPTA